MTFKLEWEGKNLKRRVYIVCEENVERSAQRVASGARKRVDVDNGDLKESIGVIKWKKDGVIGAYINAGVDGEEQIATFVELGTPGEVYTGGAYKGQKRTPIRAREYMRPALRAEKRKFAESFRNAIT